MTAAETLNEIALQVSSCTACKLNGTRKKSVPGDGSATTEIMFIGEAPGFHENEQGSPFVGASGKFLNELLANANLKRAEVFITNVVKCRPPENRDPQPDELAACRAYLDRQIAAINPLIIVTLGRFSMSAFIQNGKISVIHGKPVWVAERMIIPMYHPAAALHQPALRKDIVADFAKLPVMIRLAKDARVKNTPVQPTEKPTEPQADDDAPAQQLRLFG